MCQTLKLVKYPKIRYLLLIFMIMKNLSFASSLDTANEALKQNNILKAIKYYKISEKRENEIAMFNLGLIYYQNKYMQQNLSRAIYYFKKSASFGYKKAKYNLAIIYSRKSTKYHNYKKAYDLFLQLAKQNHAKAQYQVGNYLTYGFVSKDYKQAVLWYEQALKNGFKKASCSLAYMYANGKGVFPNFGKARILAQEGYEKKWPLCQKVYSDFNLWKYEKNLGFFK